MILSNRLEEITKMVTPCGVTADIGCDHCLTLIGIIKGGLCERGIGCDIKEGPLLKAQENIKKYGLSDKIELRKGYGLSCINIGEAEAIIISGMGGHLLIDILSDRLLVAKSAKQLILQPQNDVPALRRFLHNNGYKICDEKMATDKNKYYTIIKAEEGNEKYDELGYEFGEVLIKKGDAIFLEYTMYRNKKNEKILKALRNQATNNCIHKIEELEREGTKIKEVLKCL